MKLVWCPPGEFRMGYREMIIVDRVPEPDPPKARVVDDDLVQPDSVGRVRVMPVMSGTATKTFLRRGYWLGKYEVTQEEWTSVMETAPWKDNEFVVVGPDFPATYVSWHDALEFCRRLTRQEREARRLPEAWEYSLPTEAQWERACRARTETNYSFGDDFKDLDDHAWFVFNTRAVKEAHPYPVGGKKPNPWGLHDMHGNVAEWCRDVYQEKLPGGFDPEVKSEGTDRVRRGGSWDDHQRICCSGYREWRTPGIRSAFMGFRVVLNAVP